jgi:hypothetical protein
MGHGVGKAPKNKEIFVIFYSIAYNSPTTKHYFWLNGVKHIFKHSGQSQRGKGHISIKRGLKGLPERLQGHSKSTSWGRISEFWHNRVK